LKKKVITTQDSYRKTVKIEKKTGGIVTTADLDKTQTPREFIAENTDAIPDKMIPEIKKAIETELENRQPTFWKCNQCGFIVRREWNAGTAACIKCNFMSKEGGGFMVKMKDREINEYLAAQKIQLQQAAQKYTRRKFNRFNESRKKAGEKELSFDEFLDLQKRLSL
jgi:hypothetical protein